MVGMVMWEHDVQNGHAVKEREESIPIAFEQCLFWRWILPGIALLQCHAEY